MSEQLTIRQALEYAVVELHRRWVESPAKASSEHLLWDYSSACRQFAWFGMSHEAVDEMVRHSNNAALDTHAAS